MNQTLLWILQVAILATGIYLFLRFLRTTRGSGLLRGLLVTFVFGVIGLWGLAKYLNLVELLHIVESFTPYVAVLLTIIFQPELRRAMARLGQHNRLAKLFSSRRHETVAEVTAAATAMAARRHGALIAFQRETPLDAWTQNAARIDAEVSRHLLESIFHPGSALHDGAVVIEGERVVAAACLFPLTENIEISKSTGTRHRAALGLSEETDAVTLVVSEETGAISISDQGRIVRDIPPAELEPALRRHLGLPAAGEGARAGAGKERVRHFLAATWAVFTQDLLRKGSALLMAAGMIYLAHQNLIVSQPQRMAVHYLMPGVQAIPRMGMLDIRLPESFHAVTPKQNELIEVVVSGTQAQIERVGLIGGVIDVKKDVQEGTSRISPEMVTWVNGVGGVNLEWNPPLLEIERYGRLHRDLIPECVPVDSSNLDKHFVANAKELEFSRTSVDLQGPQTVLDQIAAGELPFKLSSIAIAPTDHTDKRVQLGLDPELLDRDVSIVGGKTVDVTLKIEPAPHDLGLIEIDIAVVKISPTSEVDPAEWSVAQEEQKATFNLTSAGLFDSDPGTEAFTEKYNLIRTFVTLNMDVYVDVSELQEGGTVPVHYEFPRKWKEALFAGREQDLAASAKLEVELVSAKKILLTKR